MLLVHQEEMIHAAAMPCLVTKKQSLDDKLIVRERAPTIFSAGPKRSVLCFGSAQLSVRLPFRRRTTAEATTMSLQYVEPTTFSYPPSVIYARTGGGGTQKRTLSKGGGNQQGAGKPTKKATKKAAKKKKK